MKKEVSKYGNGLLYVRTSEKKAASAWSKTANNWKN